MNKVNMPVDAFSYALSEHKTHFWHKLTLPYPYVLILRYICAQRGGGVFSNYLYSHTWILNPNSTLIACLSLTCPIM